MNLTPDRQGYLGDLMSKSLPQLWELLERQESLLSKRKLLEQLPDKGEKTKNLATLLRKIIEEKTGAKKIVTHENLSAGTRAAPTDQAYSQIHPFSSDDKSPSNVQHHTPTINRSDGTTVDMNDSQKLKLSGSTKSPEQDETDVLVSGFQNLVVGTEQKQSSAPKFENSYERVIKKKDATEHHQKFVPNRPLHEHHQRMDDVKEREKNDKESRYEESAVHPPRYKCAGAKLISIEESIQLIEEHKKRNEELAAERATAKLAEQFSDRMSRYNPHIPDMGYRETDAAASDLDSDDEEVEQDEECDENLEALDGVD